MSEGPTGVAGGARAPSWRAGSGTPLPLIIGHRGASALEPENSIAAFVRARTDGADGVELDVLLCASGEVIVFHDDDLARLGDDRRRIADMSLAQVRAVRLRSGARIPTLDEVLIACGDRMLVNIELKASGLTAAQLGALVDRVGALLATAPSGTAERILVSSFNPRAVYRWRRRVPQVPAGLLFEKESALPLRRAWTLPWVRPFAVHPERVLCTPDSVAGWHRRGYRVAVWTVDDAAELQRLTRMGVEAVITNDPARARRSLSAVHEK